MTSTGGTTVADVHPTHARPSLRAPILLGFGFGAIQAASPLGFAWLAPATVQALLLCFIAAVYVGFAVADGRPRVIAIEVATAAVFVLLASASVTGTAWLLVVGYAGHGLKDFWQERHHFVVNTRWWPPFCACIDWVVALVLIVEIAAGVNLHH
jgi:hypothetical protein